MEFVMRPVAIVREGRSTPEDDFWGGTTCRIELADGYEADSLSGLADFPIWRSSTSSTGCPRTRSSGGARHPRNREDWSLVGIFGQRGKKRPNRLGVSRCALLEVDGRSLVVEGLDAIEGRPVLDIKPWMKEFGPRGDLRQAAWSSELMTDYYTTPRT